MKRQSRAIVALRSLFGSSASTDDVARPRAARYTAIAVGTSAAVLLAVLAAVRPVLLARLDDAAYDALLRALSDSTPSGQVIIVNIDERSLAAVGQWPWPRTRIAQLVTNLRDLGASVVGMDIIFAEADRQLEPPRPGQMEVPIAADDELARALRGGRVVLGYAMTFDPVEAGSFPCGVTPLNVPIVRSGQASDDVPFFRATGAVCNLSTLVAAAGASGFLNAAPDRDGVLRRAPLLLEHSGGLYPGLALRTVGAITATHVTAVRMSNDQSGTLALSDGTTIPIDGRGNLLLRYRGKKGSFQYVSAVDVLDRNVPDQTLGGKLVLVGTTALGLREVVATPLDTLFAGVEVQATIADNLLKRDFIRRHEFSALMAGVVTLAFGLLTTIVMVLGPITVVALGSCTGVLLLWAGTAALLHFAGIYLSPLGPTLVPPIVFAVVVPLQAMLDRQRADREGNRRVTAQRFMVQSLLSLTESRSAETGRHSRRTQELMRLLAEELSRHYDYRACLTSNQIELISSLAPLHDIGKVGIPDAILNKPGKLTAEEFAEMRRHPEYGRDVIRNAEERVGVTDDAILAVAKELAYTHHEKWDGTGYPAGLRGSDIPISGRLMAVVDVYDATANRHNLYSSRMSHEESVALIIAGKARHFDPAIVDAFVRVADEFARVSRLHCENHDAVRRAG
jgi:HD-GYP domain-containing protein (c-di-GMP phosphodiesterase class II)